MGSSSLFCRIKKLCSNHLVEMKSFLFFFFPCGFNCHFESYSGDESRCNYISKWDCNLFSRLKILFCLEQISEEKVKVKLKKNLIV